MPSADYWKRRYERAEQARLSALSELERATHKLVDIAADDQQKQIDALENLILNRASLVSIERDGRKIRFTFARRGQVHRIEAYGTMDMPVEAWRKQLLED